MRRTAKTINFGIIYGLSSYGLAQTLSISREEAQNFIDKYFLSYSGIKKYTERIIDEVREKGFVQTLAGRKRFLPEINSGMAQVRNSAERMAINMPIQGTAAEIMKKAMIEVNSKVKSKKVKVILTVHDELVFECPAPDAPKAAVEVKEIMENVMKLSVPLKVDIKIGQNWEEME
jgi:DNA polymerase-1